MTTTRPDSSPSNIEIIILSRLSCTKPPSEAKIAETIADLAPPAKGTALDAVHSTLTNLRSHGLVRTDKRALSDAGHRALQTAFKVTKTPLWKDIHVSHLLALALDLPIGARQTLQAISTGESVARAYLQITPPARRDDKTADKLLVELFQLSSSKLKLEQLRIQIAERVIRDKLAMSGPVTLATMRAHATARTTNAPGRVFTGSRQDLFKELSKKLDAPCEDKASARRAIIHAWAYGNAQVRAVEGPRSPVGQTALFGNGSQPIKPTESPIAPVPQASLLQTVRDTLPRIGSDGRFGAEKVFISALWHRLERDRSTNLSLDRFETWLIDANREQQIDLVRADLFNAMDPKLIAESEIDDLGSTFHFVIDRQSSSRRPHA